MTYIEREKMKNKFLVFIFIFISIFFCHSKSSAYSTDVHRKITEVVIRLNEDKINTYISEATGLTDGVGTSINDKTIKDWIEDGSVDEDANLRYAFDFLYLMYSHFYEPLSKHIRCWRFVAICL